ncbi:LysR family transcriptional regulator [Teredinibacter sp. KSP-S5-2]|uniref:LysR family transcriptional regulator n=1 Tax=Teredinibacter sp. KSP-S5-2 TaxID=3034506 RepID=UPI00293452F5|nr:LysR family transcriptional regulator [Teredinibacter sp. KSP-S5-2]WNO11214.1 LysR family transcriptional regulator [Teredinibacter sp. KSP-S5-2]
MDIKTLQYFIDVSHLGSFADAARKHDVDPSTVSRMIAGLESEVGVRLFQRTTRSQSLTEAGERYLARVEPLYEELERAGIEAGQIVEEPKGLLRVTSSVAFGQECIVPLLGDFYQRFPKIDLELKLSDDNLNLIEHKLDLAIRLGPTMDKDLIVTKLMNTQYRVVASPEYLRSHPGLRRPEHLGECSCILFTYPDFRTRWIFKNSLQEVEEMWVQGKLFCSNALALREAVRQGLGPGLLADWMVDRDIRAGRLVDLFPDYAVTATTFNTGAWMLYPSRSYLPKKVRVTIDFLKENIFKVL